MESHQEMKPKVLFVDDEANILQGLQRMLRPMRKEWDTMFAESGEQALSFMQDSDVDVVVSDMRMPGMDGATLLEKVREARPHSVRIILSGYSEAEAVLRTIGPAHQYFAKPCKSEELIGVVNRALKLRGILADPALQTLVASVDNLPMPPQSLSALLAELNSEDGSAEKVAGIISRDVGMTATILKLTNSSFFALAANVTSPMQAVRLLGFDTLKAIFLVGRIFDDLAGGDKYRELLDGVSERSLFIGSLAKAIAEKEGEDKQVVEHAFIAGALSHIGTLLLIAKKADLFGKVVEHAQARKVDFVAAEEAVLGASHASIGAYFLGLWGFTDPIVEAVAYHHTPGLLHSEGPTPLHYVHVAQGLSAEVLGTDLMAGLLAGKLDEEFLTDCGWNEKVDTWRKLARTLKSRGEQA